MIYRDLYEDVEQLDVIGVGTSRKVLSLSDEYVVKVALNNVGILQNQAEADIYSTYINTPYESLLSPAYYVEGKNYVIMKKAQGLPLLTTMTIADYLKQEYPHIKYPDSNFLRQFLYKACLHLDDIYTSQAWGIIDNQVRIIDYGCTSYIFQNYYAW